MSDNIEGTGEYRSPFQMFKQYCLSKFDALEWSKLRDLFIFLAGSLYILGFLTWSLYAWFNNLGMVPAIEAQYFIAGIVPLVIIFTIALAIKGFLPLANWYAAWVRASNTPRRRTLIVSLGTFFGIIAMLIGAFQIILDVDLSYYFLLSIWLAYYLISIRGMIDSEWHLRTNKNGITKYIIHSNSVMLGVSGFIVFMLIIFPSIPQEFGGLSPRSAYVDLITNDVTESTLGEIISSNFSDANGNVIKSDIVDVFYISNSILLLKKHGESGRWSRTYEIDRDIIKSITWLDSKSITNVEDGTSDNDSSE